MKNQIPLLNVAAALVLLAGSPLSAQRPDGPDGPGGPPPGRERGGPGGREHTATEAAPIELIPATENPPARTEVKIRELRDERQIQSNGMPEHLIGKFPNRSNPNTVSEQDYDIVIPAEPKEADQVTYLQGENATRQFRVFGITLDGVLIEPGTAETWMARREWNYEALGGAVPLGLDANYGHVQPDGNYHYHGLPTGLMKRLGYTPGQHSPIIGWAADGFPIYALYGYADANDPESGVAELTTSYRVKEGARPGGENAPGGTYDGTFFQDYAYVPGQGTLDECNGRFCVTPEFPEGTYAYFMTRDWPVIPRAFRGTPTQMKPMEGHGGPPPGGRGGPGGRPPGGPGGPPPRPQ